MSLKMPDDKFMSTVKVGEKGQIVIPKGARDLFGIEPGDTLLLMADKKQGIGIVPNAPFLDFAKSVFDVQKKPPQAAEEEDAENSTHTEENED